MKKKNETTLPPFDPRAPAKIDLLTALRPPPGFRTERILALSYSLDASVAVALLSAAFGLEEERRDTETKGTGLGKFDQTKLLKDLITRSLFLIQHGDSRFRGGESLREDVATCIQDRIFAVQRPRLRAFGGIPWVNFHPKLLLGEFRRGSERRLQLYIGSKNLTLGAAIEGGILLELSQAPLENRHSLKCGKPIARSISDFLSEIRKKGIQDSGINLQTTARFQDGLAEWEQTLKKGADDLCYVNSQIPLERISLHFQVPGTKEPLYQQLERDLEDCDRATLISPWCGEEINRSLLQFRPRKENLVFWVLESERPNLRPLIGKANVAESDTGSSIYDWNTEDEGIEINRDLRHHAKAYFLDSIGKPGRIWLGSANWTSPGMGYKRPGEENFELMVRVETRGKAHSLISGLPSLLLIEDTAPPTEPPVPSVSERIRNWLDRIQISWIDYPRLLRVRVCISPEEKKDARELLRAFRVEGQESFKEEGYRVLARINWSKLLQEGSLDVLTDRELDGKVILDSEIQLVCDEGQEAARVSIIVPVPDKVADARKKAAEERSKPGTDDILERLVALQNGWKRKVKRGDPGKKEPASAIDRFIRDVRLEKLFLSLVDDRVDTESLLDEVKFILELLTKETATSPRADLRKLQDDLAIVVKRAVTFVKKSGTAYAA